MPTQWETFPIECTGGLIQNLPEIQQGMKVPGSARLLTNFEPSVKGGYRRINGFLKWDDDVVPNSGQIFGVAFFDGNVIAVRGANIYRSTGSGWTSIQGSRTHTTKHRFHIINLNGTRKLIGVDGVNYPYSWDGTTFTNINATTDVQGASHVVEFKNHVFYSKGSLVTFSIPFDEEDFTGGSGAGSFRMPNEVTGMIVFRERLFVFTETEIKVLDGTSSSNFALSSVSNDIGCTDRDTIQEVGGDILFLAADGLRTLGGTDKIGDFAIGVANKQIQEAIDTARREYTSFSSLVVRKKSQYRIIGFFSTRESATTEGFIGAQLHSHSNEASNPDGFSWAKTVGIKAYSADSRIYQGDEYIVFCDESSYVYRLENDASNFDGTAIRSSYWTPFISFNDPTFRKTLYKITIYLSPEGAVSGVVNVNFDQDDDQKIQPAAISFDSSGGGTAFGTGIFGTSLFVGTVTTTIRKQLVGSGYNASFQFEFTSDNPPFIIDTILIEFMTNDRR